MVLRDVKAGYDLGGKMGRVNHLLFMDDLKLYGKNKRQVDTLVHTVRVFSDDIGTPDGSLIKNIDEGDVYKYLGSWKQRM